jgi:uncharacterized protein YndB with AHSA1/START domain
MRRYERFVEIDAPVERVFDMFADFEAAPRWAGGILDVRRTGRRTFRWAAETALDIDVEWEAEVVVFAPDRRIVWRSIGGDIHADCEAVFSETPAGTTLLRVVRGYDTPGGRTGRAVARFFGRHPEEQLEDDLAHLRRLAERPRRTGRGRVPRVVRVEYRDRDEARRARYEEPRARHALTPREREQEREREREREWQDRRAADEQREERAAGRYLHRGVDRLLERPPDDWGGRRR